MQFMRRLFYFKWMISSAALLLLSVLTLEAAELRVATLNLYNYLITDRMVGKIYRRDYPKPENEKKALREVVIKTDPHILAVQEMGSTPYLLEFQRDLRSEGLDFPYVILMEAADEERHTAVLSKLPFEQVKLNDDLEFNYFDEKIRVKRGLLETSFYVNGLRWTLFNLHLKSLYTARKDDQEARLQRLNGAVAIRNYIKTSYLLNANLHYLIVGDFNDIISSKTLGRLLKSGSTPISHAIPATDSRGETWTYYYKKEDVYSRFDYVLASPAMKPFIENARGKIVDWPEMKIASDHRLVYVDIAIPEK